MNVFPLLGKPLSAYKVINLDLSMHNAALQQMGLPLYIAQNLAQDAIGIGGYLEQRNIYDESAHFGGSRNIHLGVDVWLAPNTPIFAPLSGVVHSFQNNQAFKDYGPTIILEHIWENKPLYTLYGHLTTDSLQNLYEGRLIEAGSLIAKVGFDHENGGWQPHLHFQVITDLLGRKGDFYGVSNSHELPFYTRICPNPMPFVQ